MLNNGGSHSDMSQAYAIAGWREVVKLGYKHQFSMFYEFF